MKSVTKVIHAMASLKQNDLVVIRGNVKAGIKYTRITMMEFMLFEGIRKVRQIRESGSIELDNNYVYSPKMIRKATKKEVQDHCLDNTYQI